MKQRARAAVFAAAFLTLPIVSCKDTAAPISSAAISVTVKVAGVFPSDRFQIRVDDRSVTLPVTEGSLVIRALSAGTHTVSLVDLPSTCHIEGVNPATVTTSPADLSNVEFNVRCLASTGAIAVQVSVSGYTKQIFFQALVDKISVASPVKGNATTILSGSFAGGVHVVALSGIPAFCKSTPELTTSITLRTGEVLQDTALASFNVTCESPETQADSAAAIVFQRDGYVMLARESGGSPARLINGEHPAWSPDGSTIAFQRLNCGNGYCEHDLWVMSAAGDSARPVIENADFDDYDVTFSPNANKIAFIRIWLGPDQSYLTVSDLHGGSIGILSIWNPLGTPSWSPDGTRIAFSCNVSLPVHSLDLCVVNTTSPCLSYFPAQCNLSLTPLTNGTGDVEHPRWSPDGKRIAFTLGCTDVCSTITPSREPHVAIIDVATREVTDLVAGHDPEWSPDGTQLVFVGSSTSPGLRIYKFADGSVRNLTSNPADRWPSWR